MMGECLVGQWIVGVISFQKIFGLYGLERHIVEKRWGVTLVHGRRRTECEDRARILKQNSQLSDLFCAALEFCKHGSNLGAELVVEVDEKDGVDEA